MVDTFFYLRVLRAHMQGLENSSVGCLFRQLFGPFKFPIPLFAGIQRRVFNGVYGFSDLIPPIAIDNRFA